MLTELVTLMVRYINLAVLATVVDAIYIRRRKKNTNMKPST